MRFGPLGPTPLRDSRYTLTCFMWAYAPVARLAMLAIHAKDLKPVRPLTGLLELSPEPVVKPVSAAMLTAFSALVSVIVDVIHAQKLRLAFTATSTDVTAVCFVNRGFHHLPAFSGLLGLMPPIRFKTIRRQTVTPVAHVFSRSPLGFLGISFTPLFGPIGLPLGNTRTTLKSMLWIVRNRLFNTAFPTRIHLHL